MNKIMLLLIGGASLANCAESVHGDNLQPLYAEQGELILTQMVSAPFPHPKRAEGHKYKDQFFPVTAAVTTSWPRFWTAAASPATWPRFGYSTRSMRRRTNSWRGTTRRLAGSSTFTPNTAAPRARRSG